MMDASTTVPARSFRIPLTLGFIVVAAIAGYTGYSKWGGQAQSFGSISNYVYVQSLGAPEITLIDTSDDTVAGTITLPVHPDQVLVAKDLERIIYSNHAARSVSVYDLATQSVEATIDLPFVPENIVLSPDGLAVAATDRAAGTVGIIRLTDNALGAVVDGFNEPTNVSFANDSGYVFVSDSAQGQIGVIDVGSGQLLDPVALSIKGADAGAISAVTRTPNGLYGLVGERDSGKISVINFRNWTEGKTLSVGKGATRAYGTADGRFMMIASTADKTVSVISTDNFDIAAVLPGFSDVTSITTGYFETLAFVVGGAAKKAAVIDLETMKVVSEIEFGGTPGPAVVDADGKRMYVALADTNELLVIDIFAKSIIKRIANVGTQPSGVNLAATNNYCH